MRAMHQESVETLRCAPSPSSSSKLTGAHGKRTKNLLGAVPVNSLFPVLHLPWLLFHGVPNGNQTLASKGIPCAFVRSLPLSSLCNHICLLRR